jgi:hypothetical protein
MADTVAIPNEAETRARFVIPAKAGTQSLHKRRGEASRHRARLGPGLRRDDGGAWDAGVALHDGGACG